MLSYLLVCPTPGSSRFKVTLWAVSQCQSEIEVLRSSEDDWIALSTTGVLVGIFDDRALGSTDACIARGETISHRLNLPLNSRLGLLFERVGSVPPDIRSFLGALSDEGINIMPVTGMLST